MDPLTAYMAAIAVCMILSAFFSGSETALVSADPMKLERLGNAGDMRARRSVHFINNSEKMIGMLLVGNNIVNITAASFLTYVGTEYYSLTQSRLILMTAAQTIVVLLFCELFPKVFTRSKSESFLMFFSAPLMLLSGLFQPFSRFSVILSEKIKRIAGIELKGNVKIHREEIDILFKIGRKTGIIEKENQVYVSEVLQFKNTMAIEIMKPTIDLVMIDIDDTVRKLVTLISKNRYTRIPVYRDRVDNIIGYVFYRDLFSAGHVKAIEEVMIKAHYVPETKNIYDLYLEMQENLFPIVFVVNEYGAVIGMVSYEDIAEEIVGEIHARDQFDDDLIKKVTGNKYVLHGDLDIDYFVRQFGVDIDKKGFKTISGFIMSMLGKIPRKGDRLDYRSMSFVIDRATDRSVEKVILYIKDKK
jgi:CBS domain containing-hemolysin-like protein